MTARKELFCVMGKIRKLRAEVSVLPDKKDKGDG